ncbi:MAG TPA: cell division topological specificity factor MinE [Ktedonobacteraceae bacterium]
MGVFAFMNGRKKLTPGEMAKERLKVVLVQDRIKLSPAILDLIRADLMEAISRRLDIDEQNVELILAREDHWDKLYANVPIKRQKIAFEWDPPSYTPSANALRGETVRVEIEAMDEE